MSLDNITEWVCSGCGAEFLDWRKWAAHIETCPKHPLAMKIKEQDAVITKLKARIAELEEDE